MSTARVVADYRQPGTDVDENTVLTDYWLSFFSARQQDEKKLSAGRRQEIELQLDDFCRRLNSLSESRTTLFNALDNVRQGAPDLEFSFAPPGLQLEPVPQNANAAQKGPFPTPRMPFYRRVRSSALFATIQKLF